MSTIRDGICIEKVRKVKPPIKPPLQGSSGDYKSEDMNNKWKVNHSQKLLQDQLLISRVRTYMHENENKVYIDVKEMADSLQSKYREYRVKKRGPFRALVRKAYNVLTEILFTKKYASHEWTVFNKDDDEVEVDVESDTPTNTMLDGMLLNMYKKSEGKQNGNSSDKELIDISSDDDLSEVEPNSYKKIKENDSAEKELPQTPGPSSWKPVPAKEEIEQPKAVNPIKEVQRTSSIRSPTRKRQREKENDSGQYMFTQKTKGVPVTEPKVTFADVGGSDKVLKTVCKLLAHMKHPEIFKQLGISPPRGFLLHGPPGCGKTLLAYAIAGELEVPLLKVAAPELVAGVSGESEARIRELFEQGLAFAPSVIFLDEIDAVAPHRATAQREMERRIVAQLLSCLDELNMKENGNRVLVIGATNRPDSLDPALRRAGRFDREVCLGIPDRDARAKILAVHTEKVALAPNVSLSTIASLTPGFVGADLVALIREAAMAAVDRVFEDFNRSVPSSKSPKTSEIESSVDKESQNFENSGNVVDDSASIETSTSVQNNVPKLSKAEIENSQAPLEMDIIQEPSKSPDLTGLLTWLRKEPPLTPERLTNLCIEHSDFEVALRVVQPSAKREGFATVPDVTWDDVGSLQDIRQELQMAILAPIRHSEHFAALGLTAATGVLLCGPPGCGKTLLAKAIANEAGINFISVKGPELLNMYVGESEKAVRQCFIRARNSAPCVIFFDELDALCPRRSDGDNSATSRVVNQMLTEMDGVEGRQGVYLMAASNRPDIIDPAVLRPGRLDKILYVGLPTAADRVDILRALTKNATRPKLAADVNLEEIGYNSKCDGYTGADLAALIREAGIEALRELMVHYSGQPEISMRHVLAAFDKVRPSVQEKDIKNYEKLRRLYSVRKKSEDTPMETPIDAPIVDVVMEPMET